MEPLRFGIIGCGVIANVHAAAIAALSDAVLIGVCDQNTASAERLAKEHGVITYPTYGEMLADPRTDAIIICTPSGLHAEQATAALRAGKHVVLEKPMALTAAEAKELCREAEIHRHLITVISQNRFRPDVQRLRHIVKRGELGTPVFCDLYMKFWRDPSYYANSTWRGTWRMDGGGALMNQGIHGVDLIRYLMGELKLLRGRAKTVLHDIEVEDTAAALLEFDCGALGVIEASTASYPGFSRRIELHGSRGYATLVDSTLEKLCIDGEMLVDRSVAVDPGTASDPTQLGLEGHRLQLRNFIAAVRGEEPLLVTANDGYEAVRLIEEIYCSSKAFENENNEKGKRRI